MNISPQCTGNGIDWQSGNGVHLSDSVIQGWSQFGFRGGVRRGGGVGTEFHNVYMEASASCTNPLGNVGQAAVIEQGRTFFTESPAAGIVPRFANTGTTDYRYYLVARHATFGLANPLYAGKALTNGTGNITVTTPDIAGASTFDLLRVTPPVNSREQAPNGTGTYAVVTGVTRASACASGICTFTDTQAALSSYTVAVPSYFPLLDFWPGGLILSPGADSGNYLDNADAILDKAGSSIVAVRGSTAPSVTAKVCSAAAQWTPIWMSCFSSDYGASTLYEQPALLLAVKLPMRMGARSSI